MNHRATTVSLLALLSFSTAIGCRRKVEPAPAPSTGAPATSAPTDEAAARRRADSLAAASLAQRRADSIAAANAAANSAEGQRIQAELQNVLRQRVYFDYDKDLLRDDAATLLDAKAAVLLANSAVSLSITGHTDERGTAEYNLALGQRRAAQVKRYLVSKGVSDERLATGSLGDSSPLSNGTDEAAYQQNRRAEFVPRNADRALVRPQP